ncbi:MAG: phospho-N-acetylmuramoyl-pentapeptide-transferase [Flavobacteriaceae bacterium]|nr:phospho-N-acetylmuramoyl-pentapeptide-transferase [Flavobacteriaceae bacterium]MCY4268195.1 phospho-N-acetylmuramoyl-pentapeptide-transferase [Flavobacteriaceae bacterium]MCY4300090.1 phospho-N-acetylmuramoyl-pentapeptide-transferase [Flavobacteriaceae bacterium]
MFYYLFQYLESQYQLPGSGLFQFLTFRSALAGTISIMLTLVIGTRVITWLKKFQIKEVVRDLGLDGQKSKEGTPTMGGIIIILATIIPVLLMAKLHNIYIIILMVTILWMGFIGGLDDYLKVKRNNKKGVKGSIKIAGQVALGLFVGTIFYFHPEITVRSYADYQPQQEIQFDESLNEKATITTIPFVKNNQFDYKSLISWMGQDAHQYTYLIFVPIIFFILAAVSNGANLTDGLDGLAVGTSVIVLVALGIFIWVSGNLQFADYLNIMYIPNIGEMTIFLSAFLGALIGFLWFNSYPANVFMGDIGSLTVGAVISVITVLVRKELILPLLCGVFFVQTSSVLLQVGYFKYTKARTGIGKRIFKMAPLHHHFQKSGLHESKITIRFWIFGIICAILSIITLKLR